MTATVLAGIPVDVCLTFRRPGVVNVCADSVGFGEDAGECPVPDSDASVEDAGGEDAGPEEDAGLEEDASIEADAAGDGYACGDGDVDC